ncbi:MAG: AAA family ATPase [Acidimicrobiia bacterium]|nr:AAA family ATPase [Acidimicrobiia bacterium]
MSNPIVEQPATQHPEVARSINNIMDTGVRESAQHYVIPTGFEPLDSALDGGVRTGDLVLVGGLPGIGKTVATLQWARHMAGTGVPVVYACYEHDESSLFSRLLLSEVGDLASASGDITSSEVRKAAIDAGSDPSSFDERARGSLVLRAAKSRMQAYGDELMLCSASPVDLDMAALDKILAERGGNTAVLFVDHLQKVPAANGHELTVEEIAIELKSLAMRHGIVVVGVVGVAAGGLGLRRLRLQHLQDADGIGYEADLVLMMNDKVTAVSKRHTAYDTLRADDFRGMVVVSIEKNRNGPSGIDLEFRKDFAHYRFHPQGSVLEEQLIDGVMITE